MRDALPNQHKAKKNRLCYLLAIFLFYLTIWPTSAIAATEATWTLHPQTQSRFQKLINDLESTAGFGQRYEVTDLMVFSQHVLLLLARTDGEHVIIQFTRGDEDCSVEARTGQLCVYLISPTGKIDQAARPLHRSILEQVKKLEKHNFWVAAAADDQPLTTQYPKPFNINDLQPSAYYPSATTDETGKEAEAGIPTMPCDVAIYPPDDAVDMDVLTTDSFFQLDLDAPVNWYFVGLVALLGLAIVIRFSFQNQQKRPWDVDLFRFRAVEWLYSTKIHPNLPRALALVGLLYVLYSLLFGPLNAGRNSGHALLWRVWWPILAILPIFLGRFFCSICPVSLFAGPLQKSFNLGWNLPRRFVRFGLIPASLIFVIFGIVDKGFIISGRPWSSGQFLLVLVLIAVAFHVVFKKRVWCINFCPIGALQTVFARLSMVHWSNRPEIETETQIRDKQILPCSFGLNPYSLDTPHQCCLCGDCRPTRDSKLSLRLHAPLGTNFFASSVTGEVTLMLLIIAYTLFCQAQFNDIGEYVPLFLERSVFIFAPAPPVPSWVPQWNVRFLLVLAFLVCIALTFSLRYLLVRGFGLGSPPLPVEDKKRLGIALLPITAAALIAFFVVFVPGLPEIISRFALLVTGQAWGSEPAWQLAQYPEATVRAVRITIVWLGWLAGLMALRATAVQIKANKNQIIRRALAEAKTPWYPSLLRSFRSEIQS